MSDVKTHTATDMYKAYIKKHPDTDITYALYRYILGEFFKKAAEEILEGETLNLGHKLGRFRIKRVSRNYNKKTVNWGETNKLKAQGIKKLVYFTDDHWFRWFWEKRICRIPNKSAYKFIPTKGPEGNRKKLVNRMKNDEFAYLNYAE